MAVPTPHITAKEGDFAKTVLMPGDPLRAKYIAETYLENPVCFNEVRGMYGFTGTYKGIPVSVMGTGMGVPSISIYARELMEEYDVKTLIRNLNIDNPGVKERMFRAILDGNIQGWPSPVASVRGAKADPEEC